MLTLLLALIYLAFISLGLSDSLLGPAWPVMREQLGVPNHYAGIISMVITGGTIISSLLSDRLTRRMGVGRVAAISVLVTALALLGFSRSSSLWMLAALALPYGLAAGALDAALNNYVALRYAARHMSWLHAFWGVGASISPALMGAALAGTGGWQAGYRWVGLLQLALTALLFLSLPLWSKGSAAQSDPGKGELPKPLGLTQAFRIPGVPAMLLAFLVYCGMGGTVRLWVATYLVDVRGVLPETAARFASLYYLGITFGRFLNGFVADRLGEKLLIRLGSGIILLGVLCLMIPLKHAGLALAGLIIIGLGSAPIYPSIIRATPRNFGPRNSQAIIGIQMAAAYTGSTFLPPLFGWLANFTGLPVYPYFLAIFALLVVVLTERVNTVVSERGYPASSGQGNSHSAGGEGGQGVL